jgi:hypothetical protein
MKSFIRGIFFIAVLWFCNSKVIIAQWSTDPNVNNTICTMTNDQSSPAITDDGSGGAIITWVDYRNGNSDIYAQRINANGAVQWTANGVAICTATGNQAWPSIVSDGIGGAIITWHDYRSGNLDIYAQRINADSIVQWNADGVALCTASGNQSYPTIVSDGSGGAIIAWQDTRSVAETGVYVQRINASGTVQWTENGVALCTVGGTQSHATSIISDGNGGAIVTWEDARSQSNSDIYAQRINADGAIQWTANGVAICTAINNQIYPSMVSDGSGGAFITWQDLRSGNYDIYAQRINADSTVEWAANGIAICTASDNQSTPNITRDDSGGAIITWHDNRSGNLDIYAQRINADSTLRWTADGAAVCTVAGGQAYPVAVSDGSGGAVILWWDYRDGVNYNIYAQQISAGGTIQWLADGVAVCTATGYQSNPLIVSDGSGGAIATWEDQRIAGNSDIYAQRIYSNGNLYTSVKDLSRIVPNEFKLGQNYPNPFNPSTTVEIGLPVKSRVTLRVYNMLGQEVALLINGRELPAGLQQVSWMAGAASGVYIYRMEAVSVNDPGKRFVEAKKMLLVK